MFTTESTAHISRGEGIEYRDHLEIDLRSALCVLIIMILISISDPGLSSRMSRGVCHANTHPVTCNAPGALQRERLNIKMIHSDQPMLIYLIMMTDAGRPQHFDIRPLECRPGTV